MCEPNDKCNAANAITTLEQRPEQLGQQMFLLYRKWEWKNTRGEGQKTREGDQNPLELPTLSESELGLLFGLLSACAKYSKLLINTPAMANGLAKLA